MRHGSKVAAKFAASNWNKLPNQSRGAASEQLHFINSFKLNQDETEKSFVMGGYHIGFAYHRFTGFPLPDTRSTHWLFKRLRFPCSHVHGCIFHIAIVEPMERQQARKTNITTVAKKYQKEACMETSIIFTWEDKTGTGLIANNYTLNDVLHDDDVRVRVWARNAKTGDIWEDNSQTIERTS